MLSKGVTKVRTQNPLVISVIKGGTLLMFVRVEISINKTHLKAKAIVTNATYKDTQHKIAGPKP